MLGSAKHLLWVCPAYRETRFDFPPTHQHQGETAIGNKLKWERGLMHDLVEKDTPGRTHDDTVHVWIHPSVVGNSFGGKLFVDASLMCKHGSQGGQTGRAVAQIHETSHELVCSADGAMPISLPVQRRIWRAELWALWQAIILWAEMVHGGSNNYVVWHRRLRHSVDRVSSHCGRGQSVVNARQETKGNRHTSREWLSEVWQPKRWVCPEQQTGRSACRAAEVVCNVKTCTAVMVFFLTSIGGYVWVFPTPHLFVQDRLEFGSP